MLLKLIKTQEFISGAHCEVWEINPISGDRLLAKVFVLNEHLPLELHPWSILRLAMGREREGGVRDAVSDCGSSLP